MPYRGVPHIERTIMKMLDWHGNPIDAYKATRKERIHESCVFVAVGLLAILFGALFS